MNARQRLDQALHAAIGQGLLPAGTQAPAQDNRPWPAVLLMALGAWLAALPLIGVVGLVFGEMLRGNGGVYVVGLLVLAAALVVLRSDGLPLFVEQLAVPALLVGLGAIGFGLFRDLHDQTAAAVLGLLCGGLGVLIRRPWLRVPLGAAAALLFSIAWASGRWLFSPDRDAVLNFGLAWQLALLLWLAAGWVQRRQLQGGARAPAAAALESLSAGWLLATLGGLAWWSGPTMLLGGALGGGLVAEVGRDLSRHSDWLGDLPLFQAVSLGLAFAALLVLARAWPGLRKPWLVAAALVPVLLAGFMPALGATLLALAVCLATARWRLAAVAALAAAWVVGSFYDQLAWPLAIKALVLAGAGALLGALAAWPLRAQAEVATSTPQPPAAPRARAAIALAAVAVMGVANLGIWQKEDLIAHGQPVFVALAPADPRSLMQGDYMRLNFRLPESVNTMDTGMLSARRPQVVALRDERGVATLLRLHENEALAAGELLIELTPKDGRWILVSDAWFFTEGEAARWAGARFGEFRVGADGRALLVSLRGADLQPL